MKFEGILSSEGDYTPDSEKADKFLKSLSEFCSEKEVDLIVISGFYEKVALEKFEKSFVKKYVPKKNFLFVDDDYISSKAEVDEKLHKDNLEKDPFFVDSFFKQKIISSFLDEKGFLKSDALLLCNDIWVDGYYTIRFSGIDFAIFEKNILDRSKESEKIEGLIYFDLDFEKVKKLLEKFPDYDYSVLDEYVFETMKKVIMKDIDLDELKKKIGDSKNVR